VRCHFSINQNKLVYLFLSCFMLLSQLFLDDIALFEVAEFLTGAGVRFRSFLTSHAVTQDRD
jgi:hypothetical protein